MIDDSDGCVTLLGTAHHVARKPHKCSECYRMIEPGERYLRERHVFEREASTHRTCSHCQIVRQWLDAECGGWLYGSVGEDISEHARYGIGPARMSLGMQHRWRYSRSGRLMPVPRLPMTTHERMQHAQAW